MVQRVHLGMFIVVCAAFTVTASVVCLTMVARADLPFWSVISMGEGLSLVMFGTGIGLSRPPLPRCSQAVWMLVRTAFRTFSFVFSLVALKVGATPGDIAALTSINTVVAAVMGHYFLSEKLRPIHVSALVCTIAGAVFITQPAFMFGHDGGTSPHFGYLLAMMSGFMKAGDFVSARKCPEMSFWHGSFLAAVFAQFFYIFFAVSDGEPQSLGALQAVPLMLVVAILVVFLIDSAAMATSTAGGSMCPAAVGATLYTGSSIVFGYASQALIFDLMPEPFTLLGATLLLIAVVIMSTTRMQSTQVGPDQALDNQAFGVISGTVRAKGATSAASVADLAMDVGAARAADAAAALEGDETESLTSIVSFMATEFAAVMPESETEAVRLRRRAGQSDTKQAPQAIGAAMALAAVAV